MENKTVEELIIEGKKHLHSQECKMLLASLLNYDSLELLNHLDEEVNQEMVQKFQTMISARKANYPLQYVIGDVNFYGLTIKVDERALIPRFETEELVEKTLSFIKEKNLNDLKILDLACGAGAIGLSLKSKLSSSEVTGSDISLEALSLAKENANNLKLEIEFIHSDLLEEIEEKFDLIISNLPYIAKEEEIEEQVHQHEPHLALYAGADGLDLYRRFFSSASKNLNEKFLIAIEHGADQKEELIRIIQKSFPNAQIISFKDMSNRDRILLVNTY